MKRQNIQILRVLACFGVFIVHMGQQLEFQGYLRSFTDFGAMGVYLFFIISGYVCWISFNRRSYKEKLKLSKYYIGRFARIVPLYYAVILGQFILHTYILDDVPADETHLGWIRYILCISGLIPANDDFWNNLGGTWTIGSFVLFYLFAPFLYRYIKNFNTALTGWFVTYIISFILVRYSANGYNPFRFLQYFLFGIVIYYIEVEKKEFQLILFYTINLLTIAIHLTGWSIHTWVMLFGLLILGSSNLVIKNNFLSHCVNILDEYSYSIYLIHPVFIEYVARWKLSHTMQWKLQAFMILLAGTTVGVIFAHNLIEKPIYNFITRLAKSKNNRK